MIINIVQCFHFKRQKTFLQTAPSSSNPKPKDRLVFSIEGYQQQIITKIIDKLPLKKTATKKSIIKYLLKKIDISGSQDSLCGNRV